MTPERWAEVRALLADAMDRPPEAREVFLDAAGTDPETVAQAKRLLSFDRQASAVFSIETWQGRAERSAVELDLSGVIVGNYRLLRELGRGGMGAVYLAERADGTYQQKVAVKILQENIFSPALDARFRQERQILARLTHPGIARLLDGGLLPDTRPYLVLEFVDGLAIDQYSSQENLSIEDRLRLFVRVAEIVQSAHQQLILHLDLKPANILVTAAGEPRLLDFGLARIFAEADTRSENTLRLLTPRYASPEQATGAPLGVASDIFSLGTLLYKLLTGRLPYPLEDATPLQAIRILSESAPDVPSTILPALRGDLDTILLKALRKEPERRYPTAAAFAQDVERHLASEPVAAHADSLQYRAGKFFQRNRGAVLSGIAMTMLLIASGIAVVHSASVARKRSAEAEVQRAKAVQRFDDLRTLAHSYLFDIDAQLEPIPGTINARAFVMQNGLKYLDRLSLEAEGDDDLTREVSQGYSQMSFVQANDSMPSLNHRRGALDSARKAQALQQRLFERNPTLPERMQLLRQMRVLEQQTVTNGDPAAAQGIIDAGWKLAQPVLDIGPSAPRFMYVPWLALDRVIVMIGNGDQWNLADPVGSESWLNLSNNLVLQTIQLHPELANTTNFTLTLSNLAFFRAELLQQLGRDSEAEPLLLEALHAVRRGPPSPDRQQAERAIETTLAEWLLRNGRLQEAKATVRSLRLGTQVEPGSDHLLAVEDTQIKLLTARFALREGHMRDGFNQMDRALLQQKTLYSADTEEIGISSVYAHSMYDMAEEKSVGKKRRAFLYQQAAEVARHYRSTHPAVLSAAMLEGRCALRLAQLAQADHFPAEMLNNANSAAALFHLILQTHPVQPEADRLLQEAKALGAQ